MADDFPIDDDHASDGEGDGHAPKMDEFGIDFEFDDEGIEPGLELDRSGFAPEEPEPAPAPPPPAASSSPAAGPAQPGAPQPGAPHPGAPGAPPAPARRPPPPQPPAPAGPSPKVIGAIAIVAMLVILVLGSMLGGEPDSPAIPVPEQALIDGERAIHQGKWVDALRAFNRLNRFPTSDEAREVRERGLEEKALKEIMEAEPSSTAVQRLEDLVELYPERPEVRERLGEVRKALSSGARGGLAEEDME